MRQAAHFFLVCITCVSCYRPENAPAANTAGNAAAWAPTRDALIEEYLRAQPAFAVYQGRHEFDGQLPDWSAEAFGREIARLHAARDRANAVVGLNGAEAFERDYLVSQFDDDLFWLEDAGSPYSNPAFYVGTLDPSPYLTRDYAPLATRMRSYITYARSVQRAAVQIRANFSAPSAKLAVAVGSCDLSQAVRSDIAFTAPAFASANCFCSVASVTLAKIPGTSA